MNYYVGTIDGTGLAFLAKYFVKNVRLMRNGLSFVENIIKLC